MTYRGAAFFAPLRHWTHEAGTAVMEKRIQPLLRGESVGDEDGLVMGRRGQSPRSGLQCGMTEEVAFMLWEERASEVSFRFWS